MLEEGTVFCLIAYEKHFSDVQLFLRITRYFSCLTLFTQFSKLHKRDKVIELLRKNERKRTALKATTVYL